MERLDRTYLQDLVLRAGKDSNAFAELYAAVSQRLYAYVCSMSPDEASASAACTDVWCHIQDQLPHLPNRDLFLPWALRICYRTCLEAGMTACDPADTVRIKEGCFTVEQLLQLPLLQSQVILMTEAQHWRNQDAADMLNLNLSSIRRIRNKAGNALKQEGECDASSAGQPVHTPAAIVHQNKADALAILEHVYRITGRTPNTVPMEALASYTVYRKERFSLQRSILAAAMCLFAALPVLFVLPGMQVSETEAGERGLPVYTVDVSSLIPLRSVTAVMNNTGLPVYEASGRQFTIEPTRNGELTIRVELLNRQSSSGSYAVTAVDNKAPQLTGSEVTADSVILYVEDEGIGVHWRNIYAITNSGETVMPSAFYEESGQVVFARPNQNMDVYIPDHIGNILHLAITLKQGKDPQS